LALETIRGIRLPGGATKTIWRLELQMDLLTEMMTLVLCLFEAGGHKNSHFLLQNTCTCRRNTKINGLPVIHDSLENKIKSKERFIKGAGNQKMANVSIT